MLLVCDSYALYMYHIFSWNDVIGMCIKTRLLRNALTSSCWTWCLAWFPWWRHQMETFSVLQAIYAGNSPGQWRAALLFSLICTGIKGWLNNGEAGDLRRHRAHYDVMVMYELPTLRDADRVPFYQSNAPSDGVLGMFTGNTTWHHLCKNRQRRTAVRVDFLNTIENRCTLK